MSASESGRKVISVNRRARYDYEISETLDAGLVLTGTEIKSIRAGRVNLRDGFARVENGEVWLQNVHISPYEPGNRWNVDPLRPRKLLVHRHEISRLAGKTQEQGMTLVALRLYLQRGYAKIELGLGKGRRLYDKRRALAEKEERREIERQKHARR
jgi:SsrA-binding protein